MSCHFDLRGKVIAVTGSASGIGLALAELLVRSGAKVSMADVESEALEQAAESIRKKTQSNDRILTTAMDVRDNDAVSSWIEKTVQKFGILHGAANIAGVIPRRINIDRLEELDLDDWHKVLDINLTGVMLCMRAQIPSMAPGGSIVNATSVAGVRGIAKNAAYVASKHGVVGLTRAAAIEVGDRGIRVNCIAPGPIDTPMSRKSAEIRGGDFPLTQPIKRKGTPLEVAELVAWLLCDSSSYITGSVQPVDGGLVG